MTDDDANEEEIGLRYHTFVPNRIGLIVRDRAVEYWQKTAAEDRVAVLTELQRIASFIWSELYSNQFQHSGCLRRWASFEHMTIGDLSVSAKEWQEQKASMSVLQVDDDFEDDDEGFDNPRIHGRTLPFEAASDDWLFVRFGQIPKAGKSIFGLAVSEGNEDGPDPWRVETGNMTHEAGVSVFKAYRHPDYPGNYVLEPPAFELARYDARGQESHLLSVIPQPVPGRGVAVLLLQGALKTIKGAAGALRSELGSDGEYLIDTSKSYSASELNIADLWVTERLSVLQLLSTTRGFSEQDYMPGIAPRR